MFIQNEKLPTTSANNVLGTDIKVEELPLPADFVWGVATASYQIEGAPSQDGKGPSIWDEFTHLEPSRTSGANGDVACDHYNRMPEDVDLIASYGAEVYRFSISWARIIPLGGRHDKINKDGIAFYNNLINKLIERGIKPVITLYHWDLPLELEKRYGGLLNTTEFQADFLNYAKVCFSEFGDRVSQWVTFNEPYVAAVYGYATGTLAPGHSHETGFDSTVEPFRAAHSQILAHAAAVDAYVTDFQSTQGGEISIVLNGDFYDPYNPSSEADKAAAQRRIEFYIGWFADPIYLGTDYPASMRAALGSELPHFTEVEQALLRKTAPHNTFYGMNHYTSQFARAGTGPQSKGDYTGNVVESATNSEGLEIGEISGTAWLRVTPVQFRSLLNWIWNRYKRPIYVTENGCPCPREDAMSVEEAVNDNFRVRYLGLYLDSISRAIYEDGVKVVGHYAWSLMDNLEWSAGFSIRFGITHVDFDTLIRTPKSSAKYLRETYERRRSSGGGKVEFDAQK